MLEPAHWIFSWLNWLYPLLVGGLFATIWVVNDFTARRTRHFTTRHRLDDLIPFLPIFALPYFSAYVLGNGAYLFLREDANFTRILLGYLLIYLLSNISYLLLPTRVERREQLTPDTASTHILARFQHLSKPFNNFPSMHVSYCLFSALVVATYADNEWGGVLLVWAGVVALSTLFTKQHHLLDVAAGALLATLAYWVVRVSA
ncbi:MAG: phosphatase PAP2 family protein [Chloroflexi bacterium]|nr:phosphatase PAP2 family protein [Chloroflexota bacterium]